MRNFLVGALTLGALGLCGTASAQDLNAVVAQLPCAQGGEAPALPSSRANEAAYMAAVQQYNAWIEQRNAAFTCGTGIGQVMEANLKRLVDEHDRIRSEAAASAAAWQQAQSALNNGARR